MFTEISPLNEAFDKTLKELRLTAKDVCAHSGVSPSRLSQFRSGNGGDIGVRSLDALLNAAQSLDSRAVNVFAQHLGSSIGIKSIDDMSMAEKGELIMALGKSIQTSKNTDSESAKTA
jgi:transcriptional regulator with XRE-family HTH domain